MSIDYSSIRFPTSIDSTMLSAYDSCPTKFFNEFILKRVPIGRSIHLHAGGCAASAFERIRIEFYSNHRPLEECKLLAFKDYVLQWGDFDAPEKEYKDFVNVWAAVEAYFDEYPPDTDYFQPYMKDDGTPAVEFRFAIPTHIMHPDTGEPILFSGRLDMLSSNAPGVCYAMDEKTTKSLGASWQYQWDMRGQFHGYTYAAQRMGFPCVGAVVRGIAIQQTQINFQEKVILFTDYQINRWWIEANVKIHKMTEDYKHARVFMDKIINSDADSDLIENAKYRMFNSWGMSYGEACGSYGGCIYKDACQRENPWSLLEQYETRAWDPLAKDPAKDSENRLGEMGDMNLGESLESLM